MARTPASTPAAAAPSSAPSAPSSTCRAGNRGAARRTTWSGSCAHNLAHGIRRFFITDDNFARNKDWEQIFDRLIEINERDSADLSLIIQVDTLCHRLPNFIEKAARAGVRRVFIGLENISPDNLAAAKKKQNKITEYRKMLLAWKNAKVITYCGYILGFPNDTPERIERDIKVAQRELPIDLLEFFFLTPLPGSEDHKKLSEKSVWMDPDLNKYDLNHAVTGHPTMSKEDWERDLLARLGDLLFRRARRARRCAGPSQRETAPEKCSSC